MENNPGPEERTRNWVYYAFLVSPFVFLALILEIYYGKSFDYVWGDSMPVFTYMMVAVSFVMIAVARPLRNQIWGARKKSIRSIREFNTVYFSTNCVSIAFLESPSVYGLLIFLLTGGLVFPLFMLGLSFVAMLLFFPKKSEKEELIKQFHFDQ